MYYYDSIILCTTSLWSGRKSQPNDKLRGKETVLYDEVHITQYISEEDYTDIISILNKGDLYNIMKKFSVVQFIARPFKEIDDYVCIPNKWVEIPRRRQDEKIVIAYPRDEEKSVTRERVKNEKGYDNDWKFWVVNQKYECDTIEDADLWIAARKDNVPLSPQNLSINATQSTSASSKELRKIKSDSKKETPVITAMPFKIARKPLPRITVKRSSSDDVEAKQKTKRGRKKKTIAAEPTDASTQHTINVEPGCSWWSASFENEPKIIHIMDGDDSQQDQQPTENDDNSQNLGVDMLATQKHLLDDKNSSSNLLPQNISNVQPLATILKNKKARNDSPSNGPSTSQERLQSTFLNSARIVKMMEGKPISSDIEFNDLDIEGRKRLENVLDHVITRRQASNLNQSTSHQRSTITGPVVIGGQRIQPRDKPINFQNISHLAGRNTEMTPNAALNSRAILQSISSIVSDRQNLENSSQQRLNFDRQPTNHRELYQRTLGISSRDSALELPRPVFNLDSLGGKYLLDEHTDVSYWTQRIMNERKSNLPDGRKWRPSPVPTLPRSRSPPPSPQEVTRDSSSPLFLSLPDYVQRTLLATRSNYLSDEERTRGHQRQRQIELDYESWRETETEDAVLQPPQIVTHDLDDDLEFVPEEQIIDDDAAATDQISSSLNNVLDGVQKLQTAIIAATTAFNKLLENNTQRINSSENSASQPSTSRDTVLFESASFNGCQDSNNMEIVPEVNANLPLPISLPLEYDPNNTAWTLMHEKDEPGLHELMPYTRIYIKFLELKYWEEISAECPSLARRILRALFKKNALSVCASINEKEPNGRPKLNEHAWTVLIDYVIGQGVIRGWSTKMQPILEALDDEIKRIRAESTKKRY